MCKFKYLIQTLRTFNRKSAARFSRSTAPALIVLTMLGTADAQDAPRPTIINIPVSLTSSVSPCSGESLRITGRIFFRVERELNEDGSTQIRTFGNLQALTGQGQISSAAYRFTNGGLEEQSFQCPQGQKCLSQLAHGFQLTGSGPNQNISGFVIVRIDERPDGDLKAELQKFDFVCHQ